MPVKSRFKHPKVRLCALAAMLALGLSGCASQSGQTFAMLDRNHPQFHSEQCQAAIRDTEIHDDVKLLRSIASPVAVVLSGGLLLPAVFASNVGLDTVDRVDASRLDISCGGAGQSAGQIAEGVVKGAAFGLATSAVGTAVGAGALPTGGTSSK